MSRSGPADFDELRVVTSAAWLARDLAAGTPLPVVADLGLDIPADTSRTAWWCSGAFAARLQASGRPLPFLAPTAAWQASLPSRWWGRPVHAARYGQARGDLSGHSAGVFAKLADVKHPRVPARWWAHGQEFCAAADGAGVGPDMWVAWTTERVQFVSEHRCFIAGGQVVAASVYLHQDRTWDAWASGEQPDSADAIRFAARVLDDLDDQPPGWVLDVGFTGDGRWVVVEANPAWCANPYHADPAGVVDSILAAHDMTHVHPRWGWSPGTLLTRWARPLPVHVPVR